MCHYIIWINIPLQPYGVSLRYHQSLPEQEGFGYSPRNKRRLSRISQIYPTSADDALLG
jgi:hypothetical protein